MKQPSETKSPPVPPVLLLGEPGLRVVCEPVTDLVTDSLAMQIRGLHRTLDAFRHEHGFGRAVAAPQIGVPRRIIAVNLGRAPFTVINPEIVWRSCETFTLWDDCMSFPSLLVKVARSKSISVRYTTESGEEILREHLDRSVSELFQHEIDHLDGVLAVDRACDGDALISREVFETEPGYFADQVDYTIQPTMIQFPT